MVLERIPQMQSKHNLAIVTNGLLTASRASRALHADEVAGGFLSATRTNGDPILPTSRPRPLLKSSIKGVWSMKRSTRA